jgi:hypothetical protein
MDLITRPFAGSPPPKRVRPSAKALLLELEVRSEL